MAAHVVPSDDRMISSVLLNEYVRFPDIQQKLIKDGVRYKLLNYNDFVNWCIPLSSIELRSGERSRDERYSNLITLILIYLNTVGSTICGETNVKKEYADKAPTLPFSDPKYDIIVAISENDRQDEHLKTLHFKTAIKRRISRIKGFIVGELGECKMRPHWWSVRLICTTSVKGIVLMGAFLYCIKNAPGVDKNVLLEVANAYKNIAGYKSYTKIGFKKDVQYFDKMCFYEFGNLPMHIDLGLLSSDNIIRRVTSDTYDDGIIEADTSLICKLYHHLSPENQELLINVNMDLLIYELGYRKYGRYLRTHLDNPHGLTPIAILNAKKDELYLEVFPIPDVEPVPEVEPDDQGEEPNFEDGFDDFLAGVDLSSLDLDEILGTTAGKSKRKSKRKSKSQKKSKRIRF